MTLVLVWAADRVGAIGRDNDIPWRIPEDQKRFRQLTIGCPVIMGRRTWESLPSRFRPLPGRHNIVVTSRRDPLANGVSSVPDFDTALAVSDIVNDRVVVMGGARLYAAAIAMADALHVTEVDTVVADADTFAPTIDREIWQADPGAWSTSESGFRYRFVDYRRG